MYSRFHKVKNLILLNITSKLKQTLNDVIFLIQLECLKVWKLPLNFAPLRRTTLYIFPRPPHSNSKYDEDREYLGKSRDLSRACPSRL